jgi:FMN phosphatase YigB (HAD superfamily)
MTIVWDVDDVLNDLMREWFEGVGRGLATVGDVTYDGLTANPPEAALGIARETYLASLDHFRETRYRSLAPLAESVSWFERNGARAHHVALTAVPAQAAHLSAEWLVRHYGRWIRTFAFAPSRAAGVSRPDAATKTEYLRWLGKGDVFVDDREENVAAAEALGCRGVVMPRPWNSARGGSVQSAFDRVTTLLA